MTFMSRLDHCLPVAPLHWRVEFTVYERPTKGLVLRFCQHRAEPLPTSGSGRKSTTDSTGRRTGRRFSSGSGTMHGEGDTPTPCPPSTKPPGWSNVNVPFGRGWPPDWSSAADVVVGWSSSGPTRCGVRERTVTLHYKPGGRRDLHIYAASRPPGYWNDG